MAGEPMTNLDESKLCHLTTHIDTFENTNWRKENNYTVENTHWGKANNDTFENIHRRKANNDTFEKTLEKSQR